MNAKVLDLLLFAVLPYVALFVFFLVTITRYRTRPFTYSSLSSQFLENNEHFFGLVSFHYGILTVLLPKAEEVKPKSIKIRAREAQGDLVGSAGGTNQS